MNPIFKDEFHAEISPVPEGVKRPLWSVLIPTYNCATFLKETLQSVLIQDPGPEKMEIIVIDDHSTLDDPEMVVNELGKGRIRFIRQEKNVGKVQNYETGLNESKGNFIHQLHGDDKIRPGFYAKMEELFSKFQEAGAAFCRSFYINKKSQWTGLTGMENEDDGILNDFLPKIYIEQRILTPSMVVKREVYENLGAFNRTYNCMEDWEMWIRIANYYPIAYTPEVLAEYRSHSSNATNLTFRDGSALKVHKELLEHVNEYINPALIKRWSSLRNRKQALFIILSYRDLKPYLCNSQKITFLKRVLELDFSFITLFRFFRS